MFTRIAGLCLIAAFSFGCAKSEEEKAQAKVDTANSQIDQLNNIISDLRNNGVTLLAYGQGCNVSSTLSTDRRQWAHNQLVTIENLGSQILSVADDDNVVLFGQYDIENAMISARLCRSKVN